MRILLVLLVAWLVVDKLIATFAPAPSVGHWTSLAGQQEYARAYEAVMETLPSPTMSFDTSIPYGSVRVLQWEGAEAGAPVVLLPGRSSGAPMWAENLPDWVGRRTVYALDPIGDAGMSTQGAPLATFDDQATWIDQTLEALGLGSAHIVGHSFGGANAAIFAVHHPDKVASLTLLEPVFVIRPLPAMIAAGAGHFSAALPTPRTLSDEEWLSLDTPLRVDIAGTKSMAGGQGAVKRLRSLLPQASVTLWPAATHSLPMQERAELGPALLEFWRTAGN